MHDVIDFYEYTPRSKQHGILMTAMWKNRLTLSMHHSKLLVVGYPAWEIHLAASVVTSAPSFCAPKNCNAHLNVAALCAKLWILPWQNATNRLRASSTIFCGLVRIRICCVFFFLALSGDERLLATHVYTLPSLNVFFLVVGSRMTLTFPHEHDVGSRIERRHPFAVRPEELKSLVLKYVWVFHVFVFVTRVDTARFKMADSSKLRTLNH